jgi:hypothetical protein
MGAARQILNMCAIIIIVINSSSSSLLILWLDLYLPKKEKKKKSCGWMRVPELGGQAPAGCSWTRKISCSNLGRQAGNLQGRQAHTALVRPTSGSRWVCFKVYMLAGMPGHRCWPWSLGARDLWTTDAVQCSAVQL